MKTVAVISEYNPFHLGHAYQYRKIREEFGEDTAIIAIMSGNYVQRGTPALLGKFDRARMAIASGASLVLELPFPFSAASAEFFAKAGVSIAEDLGTVDVLSFGSECGDTALLASLAAKMTAPEFEKEFRARLKDKSARNVGYAKLLSETFLSLYGQEIPDILSLPNNILAISYISALQKLNSTIRPHTILRHGSDEDGASEDVLAGATHVRSLFLSAQTEEALLHIPSELHPLWEDALSRGVAPVSYESFAPILLSHLRMKTETRTPIADSGGGVLSLLQNTARKACTMEELISLAATKKYTHAHLRRATLFSYFGVTPAALKQKPLYTQVLAMDERGRAILASIRKTSRISLLTKPADLHKLSESAREQAVLSYRADSVFALALPTPQRSDIFLCTAPYRK